MFSIALRVLQMSQKSLVEALLIPLMTQVTMSKGNLSCPMAFLTALMWMVTSVMFSPEKLVMLKYSSHFPRAQWDSSYFNIIMFTMQQKRIQPNIVVMEAHQNQK